MPHDAAPARTKRKLGGWPAAAALLLAVGAAAFWLREVIGIEALADRREALRAFVEASPWSAALIYLASYGLAVAISLPGAALLTVVGGFAFGWKLGAPLAIVAATAGGTVFFLAARGSFGRLLERSAGPRTRRLAAGFRADAFHYLVSLRLLPLFPFWIVNFAAALAAIPLRVFVAATLIGGFPAALAFSIAGAGLDGALSERITERERCRLEGREPCRIELRLGTLLSPSVLIALGALGCVALIPVAARRLGAKAGAPAAEETR